MASSESSESAIIIDLELFMCLLCLLVTPPCVYTADSVASDMRDAGAHSERADSANFGAKTPPLTHRGWGG